MNRMWVRLSLAFAVLAVMSFILIGITVSAVNRQEFLLGVVTQRLGVPGGIIEQLEQYFRTNNTWDGVSSILGYPENAIIPTTEGNTFALIVADAGGKIVYSLDPNDVNTRLSDQERRLALPLMVDGRTRGFITLHDAPTSLPSEFQTFLFQQLSRTVLIVAAVIGVVGMVGGVLVSLTLTSPLAKLANTARGFGKDLSTRAELNGTVEIIAVANAFNDMADALQRAEGLRRNLVADVAHEFRTPLTVLQANLQAILDDVYPLNKDEIQHLVEQTDLLSRLVRDLHDLAQAEAGKLMLSRQVMDLNAFTMTTTESFQAIAHQHAITLSTVLAPEAIWVYADANRLAQVLNNLLSNALTHTPNGRSVTVTVGLTQQQATLTVQDMGVGIPADQLPHVFERFYRIDHSRSRATGGAGLGLAIVKAIVEMHGGTVYADSEGIDSRGSAFVVQLPRHALDTTLP